MKKYKRIAEKIHFSLIKQIHSLVTVKECTDYNYPITIEYNGVNYRFTVDYVVTNFTYDGVDTDYNVWVKITGVPVTNNKYINAYFTEQILFDIIYDDNDK